MKKNFFWAALVGACLLAAAPARAIDVWDASTEDDNASGTDNGLTHGVEQAHDLGAEAGVADQDWYTLDSAGRSSYEVLVDGTTGDMNLSTGDVTRLAKRRTTQLQDSVGLAGFSRVLRWRNTSPPRRSTSSASPARAAAPPAATTTPTASGSTSRPTASRATTTPAARSRC